MAEDGADVCLSDKRPDPPSRKRNREEEENRVAPRVPQNLVGEAPLLKAMPFLCLIRKGRFALYPATLSDGQDYNLPQLAHWVDDNPRPDHDTASPSTGLTTSKEFKPNVAKQKALFHLVETGQFDDLHHVPALSEAVSEVKAHLAQLKRAWAGDLDAILQMVAFFEDFDSVYALTDDGTCGGIDGPKQAMYFWIRKAAEQHHGLCMAKYGTQVYENTTDTLDCMDEDDFRRLLQVAILNIAAQKNQVDSAALTMARMHLDGLFDGDGMPEDKHTRRSAADVSRPALVQMERSLQAAISESLCLQKILSDERRTKVRELLARVQKALEIQSGGEGNLEDVVFHSYEFEAKEDCFSSPAVRVPCDEEFDLKMFDFYLGRSIVDAARKCGAKRELRR